MLHPLDLVIGIIDPGQLTFDTFIGAGLDHFQICLDHGNRRPQLMRCIGQKFLLSFHTFFNRNQGSAGQKISTQKR
jgi:hypothetical protein